MSFKVAVTVTVTLEPKKLKSVIVAIFPPFVCYEMMGSDAMILVF